MFTIRKRDIGIKNIEVFNRALVGKWMWRLVSEKQGLWKKVSFEKYNFRYLDKLVLRVGISKGSQC